MNDEHRALVRCDAPLSARNHPLVGEHHFFTLPKELLEGIVSEVGERSFDATTLKLDRELSAICGDHSTQIGFRAGIPILYDLLGDPLSVSAAVFEGDSQYRAVLNWPPMTAAHREAFTSLDRRSTWVRDVCRAYAGWLATNAQFAAEQSVFFETWSSEITHVGLGCASMSTDESAQAGTVGDFVNARDAFLARWQLVSIAGPFLPSPARPQFPVPSTSQDWHEELSIKMSMRRIFPVPDRDQLRLMFEDAMSRQQRPAHLAAWFELVAGDSVGKKTLAKCARIFRLTHYWRVVFSRHRDALTGKVAKVREAFAQFVFADDEDTEAGKSATIRRDLGDIAAALGDPDWYRKPSAYDPI